MSQAIKRSRPLKIAFLAGNLVSCGLFVMIFLFFGYRTGYSNLLEKLWRAIVSPHVTSSQIVYLPKDILSELIRLNAVVENAGNPTNQRRHDTMLVRPDELHQFILRPNVQGSAFVLRTLRAFNFDPPVLHLMSSATFSDTLKNYLAEQTRLSYTYSVDGDGFRTTLPAVDSKRKILMVGDSVLFGVGVNDDSTISSHLQRLVGSSFRVVNAGVGNYNGDQAFFVAQRLSEKDTYDALIYVACENDFINSQGADLEIATAVMQRFSSLKHRFSDRVIVILSTYMEYTINDVLLDGGWSQQRIAKTDVLRRGLPTVAKDLGFEYLDWTDIVNEYAEKQRTIFSRFALYVDHAHLSPLGNHLAAEKLFESLGTVGLSLNK